MKKKVMFVWCFWPMRGVLIDHWPSIVCRHLAHCSNVYVYWPLIGHSVQAVLSLAGAPCITQGLVTPRVLTMHFTPARVEVSSQPGNNVWWPGDTENREKHKTGTSVTLESTFKWNAQWQLDPRTNNLSERTLHVLSSSSQSVYIAIIHEATIAPMCYTMSQSWGTMNVWAMR